jgi:hypothetical protein
VPLQAADPQLPWQGGGLRSSPEEGFGVRAFFREFGDVDSVGDDVLLGRAL